MSFMLGKHFGVLGDAEFSGKMLENCMGQKIYKSHTIAFIWPFKTTPQEEKSGESHPGFALQELVGSFQKGTVSELTLTQDIGPN